MKYIFFLMLIAAASFGQVGNYHYAVVASKFQAQNSAGQYGLNDLAKQFMIKNGFRTFLDNEPLPAEVAADNCRTLFVDVKQNNNMFRTKLQVVITDCRKQVLFTSDVGESKEKDLRLANNMALRAAFKSFDKPQFRHDPNAAETAVQISSEAPAQTPGGYLSVQPTPNGFQIVDTTPRILLRLFKTSLPGIYIGENDQSKGVFFQREGKWYFEFYRDGQRVSQPFDVSFQ
jgi:hypothetical protein